MGTDWLGNHATVFVLLLSILAAAAWLVLREINHAAASPSNSQIHLITNHSASAQGAPESEESSAPAGGSSDSGTSTNSSSTSLTVNGQNIPVPQNGIVNQTITNDGSTTTIHAESSNVSTDSEQTSSGSATNTSHSSLDVHVQSHSSSAESDD